MAEGTVKLATTKRPQTSSALVGAAILHLVPSLLFWPVAGFQFDFNSAVRVGGSLLLVALAIWARWIPLPPAIIAVIGYVGYLGALAAAGLKLVPLTVILHGSILALLIIAVVSAVKRQPAQRTEEP